MRPTHSFLAAVLVASVGVFATTPVRASDEPSLEAAALDSSAPPPVIAAAACSLHPVLIVEGRARRFDVQIDGRRCSSSSAPEDAIPLSVRIDHDPSQRVVIEASVPSDVAGELIRATVLDTRRELGSRLAPAPPPPPAQTATPHRNTAWTDAPLEPKRRDRFSPALMAVGILGVVGGGIMLAGGACSLLLLNVNPNNSPILPMALLLGGATATAVGIPLLAVGAHKVTRVTASLSPTGGSLRVTF